MRHRSPVRGILACVACLFGAPAAAQAPPDKDDSGLPRVIVAPTERLRDRVAIPPVVCKGGGAACAAVTAQIRRNMEISTFFEIIDPNTYVVKGEGLDETAWTDWSNVGARYLVKAVVSGGGIEFRLYDVLERKVLPATGQSYSGSMDDKERHKGVDRFLNGAIGVATGKPGIFGTQIVYAAKSSSQTRGIGIMEMDGDNQRGLAGGGTINFAPHFTPGGGVIYTSFKPGWPQLYASGKRITRDSNHYRGADYSRTGKLAASLSNGSGSRIWLISGGRPSKQLTTGPGHDISPAWAPDGGQLAFVSSRGGGAQIYVVPAGGGGARRITMAGGYNTNPDWGVTGEIVFAAEVGGGSDILTVTAGGAMKRITQGQGSNTNPCWSPDGRYIAFVSNRDGRKIWISSADGRWQFPVSERSGSYSALKWGGTPF